MEVRHKVTSLESLRSAPKVNGIKLVIDSLKLFNRLIIISEHEVKTKEALRFEDSTPMSLFDKDQKLRKPDKAALARLLKAFVEPVEQTSCTVSSFMVGGSYTMSKGRLT